MLASWDDVRMSRCAQVAALLAVTCLMGCGDPSPKVDAPNAPAEHRPRIVKLGFLPPAASMAEQKAHWIGALDVAMHLPESLREDAVADTIKRTGWRPAAGERTVASFTAYIEERPARFALFTSASDDVIGRLSGHYESSHRIQGAELRDDGHVLLHVGATPEGEISHRGTWTVDGPAGVVRVRGLTPNDPTRAISPVEIPPDSDWAFDLRRGTITIDLGEEGIQPVLQRESR